MTVGDRIKNKRTELGFSQDELAKRAGYNDKTAISKLEHSGDKITLKQVKRVALALNVPPEYLMGWVDLLSDDIKMDDSVFVTPSTSQETINRLQQHYYNICFLGDDPSIILHQIISDSDSLYAHKLLLNPEFKSLLLAYNLASDSIKEAICKLLDIKNGEN